MRLLHSERLDFAEFHCHDKQPRYAIASHRWHEESEVTFQDVQNRRDMHKDGYKKIEAFAKYVRDHVPSVEWLWIDTCCIDRTNAVELSEAINLMFKWYRNADVCFCVPHGRRGSWRKSRVRVE
nr:vegetative incompatibility protein het-e-1 [Quercus suber]